MVRLTSIQSSGTGRGAIGVYCYTSGECQETCRDQHHAMMGLGEIVESCEIAWKQGIDLYSLLPVNGMPRLAQCLEYTAKICDGTCMPSSCGTKSQTTNS